MSETEFPNDLLSSHPNSPATKGDLVLFRMETQSEFKTVRSELGQIRKEINEMKGEINGLKIENREIRGELGELKRLTTGIAQQVALLVERSVGR